MNQINFGRSILTALISIAVTVVGGLLLFYFQTKEPQLVYSFEKIPPFESQTEKLNIYHITIENSGDNVAEDIVCQVRILPAIVKEYRVNSETPIQFQDTLGKQEIDIKTSSLNPKESYRVSILATSNGSFPDEPNVKLRAKGINGSKKESVEKKEEDFGILTILRYLLIIAAAASTLTLLVRKILMNDDDDTHSGDQNHVIAYLCGIHGLDKQVERYLSLPNQTSYWAEMDRLATIAIATKDQSTVDKLINLIKDLIQYAGMVNTSKGIGYYNLARLYKFSKDEVNSSKNIEEAKKIIPKLLASRMKLDPLFKQTS